MKTIEISHEQFRADLRLFAVQWIYERQVQVAEQADEIWENKQVLLILHEWAEMRRRHDERAIKAFDALLDGREDDERVFDDFESRNRTAYFDILVELLFH